MAANKVIGSDAGLGLLLSGLPVFIIAFMILYSFAWVIAHMFYDAVEHVLDNIGYSFRRSYRLIKREQKTSKVEELLITMEEQQPSSGARGQHSAGDIPSLGASSAPRAIAVSFMTLTFSIVVAFLQFVRPRSPPYAHMSGSLPVTLIEAAMFQPINSEFCLAHPVERVMFPWEQFAKYFGQPDSLDWMPQSQTCSKINGPNFSPWPEHPEGDDLQRPRTPRPPQRYRNAPLPSHGRRSLPHFDQDLPSSLFKTFYTRRNDPQNEHRQDKPSMNHHHGYPGGYEPLCDPLKLSNLNANITRPLLARLKLKKPNIKNVLLLTLESTRKDMFPLKKDSHVYKTVLSSYASSNASNELDAKFGNFTNTATFLSGESNGFGTNDNFIAVNSWKNQFKDGMGSINVQGAITQAAYTSKSLLSSHCGVEPLPVDFTEEIKAQLYQSCLPHIFEHMSSNLRKEPTTRFKRGDSKHVEDHQAWSWESTMVQSITDQFDSQDLLDAQMGFEKTITESTISDPKSKYYPPKEPWTNYFGFPETESFGYLRDLFVNARQQKKRLFISHVTSTTHHPFTAPKSWTGHTEYLSKQRWQPEDPLDGYLNTIKYQDEWISEVFQMLHDVGALNETLVVITGDHGLAFKTPDKSQSAVNNGHISNFAIPLLFVHPDLPRLQLKASTTPLSIIPTILDLLLQTDSLPESAADVAKALVPKYQGNSLIRDLDFSVLTSNGNTEKAFFQPFHFSAVNPGGALLAISDASTTFRLTFPLCSNIPLRFTDVGTDPTESDPLTAWTMDELISKVKVKHGIRAKDWVELAHELGRWWFWDQHGKWGYWGNSRSTGRGSAELAGAGRVKMKHWWET